MKPPLFCIFDDRAAAEPGIRLLISSLIKANRTLRVCVFFEPASADFLQWLEEMPNVEKRPAPFPNGLGYDTKPHALLALLETGEDQVIWLDSDIIVTKNPLPVFNDLSFKTLCITEDALWGRYEDGNGARAQSWGFSVTRTFGHCLNTCVLRVTQSHLHLLKAWRDCLNSPDYQQAQQTFWADRPDHLAGDQDVMTALLSSTHGDVPVLILRRGHDIIQAFGLKGYTSLERLQNFYYGVPTFIHAQGYKPWKAVPTDWISQVYNDLSPYVIAASKNRDELNGQDAFLTPKTLPGLTMRMIGFGSIPLTGLPMAAVLDVGFKFRKIVKRLSHK